MSEEINMMIIGIDPGKTGAITVLNNDAVVEVAIFDMPTIREGKKGKEQIDIVELGQIIRNLPTTATAFVEAQNALTRFDPSLGRAVPQGAVSNFTLGKGFGAVLMGLAMAGIPFEEVMPKQWQKYFHISGSNTKEQAHGIAKRLFPTLEFTTPRGRLLDGRCDSLLIAEYGRRRLAGEKGYVQVDTGSKLSMPKRRPIGTRSKRG